MTTTTVPSDVAISRRSVLDQDWRKVINYGSLCGLGLIFIALSGMLVGLNDRIIIEGLLSLGYLSMIWLPIVVGFAVSKEVVLEGMASSAKGPRELLAGTVVGAVGGLGASFLIVLIENFDLRDPLVNWSPQLLDLLGFGRGNAFGFVAWIVLGGVLGLFGASFHVMPTEVRRVLSIVVGTVLFISIFESIIVDLCKGFGLSFITDFLYGPRGGLTIEGLVSLIVVSGVLAVAAKGRVKGAKAHVLSLEGEKRSRMNMILLGGTLALLVILPMFVGKITNELLANVGIFLLLALGLNIVVGLAGILDLGYVAFFAVGGYTTAILTSPNSPAWAPELPWMVALLVTIVAAALVGLFIGAPVIRMRGDYLAIVTLGFGEIIRILLLSDWLSGIFGGAQGITNIPAAQIGPWEVKGTDPRSVFYLVLAFCCLAIYISWRLERSRLGRAWMAIREDESVAEAMGINTVNLKLMAFVVGAIIASFGGAIFAAKVGSIFPTSFLILVSIIILVVVIVGGVGSIPGVIVGAVVLIGVLGGPKQPGLLQEFSQYKLLIYGALLIWMMLKRPEGLIPNVRRARELHQDEFLQDAWLKGEVDDGSAEADGLASDEGEVAPS